MEEEISKIYDEVVQRLVENKDKNIKKLFKNGTDSHIGKYLLQDNETVFHISVRFDTLSNALPMRVILGE